MERSAGIDVLKIRISGLSNGLHEYHFSSDPSEIGLQSNFTAPVEVDVVFDKTRGQMFLKADIHTTGLFNCDRCVDEFKQEVLTSFKTFYVYRGPDPAKYESDEVQVLDPDTVYIDLKEDVRQMIMLSIPLKLLCREECKGLCPRCGMNRNTDSCKCREDYADPRWEGLKNLLNN